MGDAYQKHLNLYVLIALHRPCEDWFQSVHPINADPVE